jgi:hypothetical protein
MIWSFLASLCLLFIVACTADTITVVDVRLDAGNVILAIQACVGLENRKQATVYTVSNDDDLFWLNELTASYLKLKKASADFLNSCFTKYGAILFDDTKPEMLPSVVTLAGK